MIGGNSEVIKLKTKECRYCKKRFSDIDFPRSFERMITCGSIECMGKRRRELWEKRYYGEEEMIHDHPIHSQEKDEIKEVLD